MTRRMSDPDPFLADLMDGAGVPDRREPPSRLAYWAFGLTLGGLLFLGILGFVGAVMGPIAWRRDHKAGRKVWPAIVATAVGGLACIGAIAVGIIRLRAGYYG
jgi:hypothetical protein